MMAPVVTASNDAATGQIKLSWKAVDGADYYIVSRSTSRDGVYSYMGQFWDETSMVDDTAKPGIHYYYKVAANEDLDGRSSDYSAVVSSTCDLARPTVTVSNVASSGKVKLTWDPVEGAVKYEVYRSTSEDGTYTRFFTTGTSVINTNTEVGTLYYYKVKALHSNTDANSAFSAIVSRTCDLARPNLTVSNVASTGEIKLSWNAVEGAVKYEVWRKDDQYSGYAFKKIVTTASLSYVDDSASFYQEGGYMYKVCAVYSNTAANSAYSAEKAAWVKLAKPVVTASTDPATGKVKLSWNAVNNAEDYVIYRSTSKEGPYSHLDDLWGDTSMIDEDSVLGLTYYYKVEPRTDGYGGSFQSDPVACTCILLKATNVASTGKIKLTWNKVEGATKYEVYRSTAKNGTYTRFFTTTGTSVINTNTEVGTIYYYKVKVLHSNINANSTFSAIVSRTCVLPCPVLTVGNVASTGKIKLSWNAVEGADKYQIWRRVGDGSEESFSWEATTTALSYVDDSASFDQDGGYMYKVCAVYSNTAANSLHSAIKNAWVKPAQPVVTASNDAASGQIKLSWKSVDGAGTYNVYRSTAKDGPYGLIAEVWDPEFVDYSAETGAFYYYKVGAYRRMEYMGVESAASSVVSRTCDLPRPVVKVTNVASSGKIKLSWDAMEGAEKYEVYRSTSKNGTYTRISTTTATSLINTKAEVGTLYYYKVRALHSNSAANSAYSSIVSRTCDLARPTVKAVNVASTGKIKLSWNAVEGADKYQIWRRVGDGSEASFSRVATTTALSYTDTGAAIRKEGYEYKIRAIYSDNTAANSAYSNVVWKKVNLGTPVVNVKNDAATGKPVLTVEPIAGAEEYNIYRSESKDGTYFMVAWFIPDSYAFTVSYIDENAVPGTRYYYKVSTRSAEASGMPTTVSSTCDLPRPSVTLSNTTPGKIVISWKSVKGAVKYELYRSTDNKNWSRISTTTKTTITNSRNMVSGTKYYYKVRAIAENTNANSAYSLVRNTTCK